MKNDCGHVYLLKNESMPGLYKIGYTTQSIQSRVDQLSKATGVPTNFECIYSAKFDWYTRPFKIEQMTHGKLSDKRVSGKEFFRFSNDEEAVSITALAMMSSCSDILSSASGFSWLDNVVTFPHGDTENIFIDLNYENGEGQSYAQHEVFIIQSDMLHSGDIERLAAITEMSMPDIIAGAIMLNDMGYASNTYEGIEIYLNGSSFFDKWLSKTSEKLHNELRIRSEKKAVIYEVV